MLHHISFLAFEYLNGFTDAISLHRTLLFYIHSQDIRIMTVKCFVLNGIFFLGSIFFFRSIVLPMIHLFGELLHTSSSSNRYKRVMPMNHIFITSSHISRDIQTEWIRHLIDNLVFVLYQVLWIYPIYCISFILSTIWYQEIAEEGEWEEDEDV